MNNLRREHSGIMNKYNKLLRHLRSLDPEKGEETRKKYEKMRNQAQKVPEEPSVEQSWWKDSQPTCAHSDAVEGSFRGYRETREAQDSGPSSYDPSPPFPQSQEGESPTINGSYSPDLYDRLGISSYFAHHTRQHQNKRAHDAIENESFETGKAPASPSLSFYGWQSPAFNGQHSVISYDNQGAGSDEVSNAPTSEISSQQGPEPRATWGSPNTNPLSPRRSSSSPSLDGWTFLDIKHQTSNQNKENHHRQSESPASETSETSDTSHVSEDSVSSEEIVLFESQRNHEHLHKQLQGEFWDIAEGEQTCCYCGNVGTVMICPLFHQCGLFSCEFCKVVKR